MSAGGPKKYPCVAVVHTNKNTRPHIAFSADSKDEILKIALSIAKKRNGKLINIILQWPGKERSLWNIPHQDAKKGSWIITCDASLESYDRYLVALEAKRRL